MHRADTKRGASFILPPWRHECFTYKASMCADPHGVLPTREAQLSLGSRVFTGAPSSVHD